jgi:hypothetical protein
VMFLVVQIAVMFYRAHQKLFSSEREERIQNVIKMVLCPPVAIRSTDLLSKEVLADYSPTLVATMLSPAMAQQFVRAYILDLQNPLKHEEPDETATEIITWAADEQLKFCLEHINRNGKISSEVLLAPPEQSEDSMSYCPRCRCQFIVESGACPDCPGVRLLAFSEQTEMMVEVV